MGHAAPLRAPDLKGAVTEAEWEARVDLAACYRLMAVFGFTDLIYNHITLSVPGEPGRFLINPYGRFYDEVTASSLHVVDLEGNVIRRGDPDNGVNRAGYVIHSAVHAAREDAACVIHTHTRWDAAVSAMDCGLLPISQTALRFHGRTGYHEYQGPAIDEAERQALVANLGRNDALILRNHGALVCGRSVAEAFHLMQRFQTACQIQVDLMAAGAGIVRPSTEAQERTARMFAPSSNEAHVARNGQKEWAALLRRLDREDESYKC